MMAIPLPAKLNTSVANGSICICCSKDSGNNSGNKHETQPESEDQKVVFRSDLNDWCVVPQPSTLVRLFGCCCREKEMEENIHTWEAFGLALKENTGLTIEEVCELTDINHVELKKKIEGGKRLKLKDYEKITKGAREILCWRGQLSEENQPSNDTNSPEINMRNMEVDVDVYDERNNRKERFSPDRLADHIRLKSKEKNEEYIQEIVACVIQVIQSQGKEVISTEEIRQIVEKIYLW